MILLEASQLLRRRQRGSPADKSSNMNDKIGRLSIHPETTRVFPVPDHRQATGSLTALCKSHEIKQVVRVVKQLQFGLVFLGKHCGQKRDTPSVT